MQLYRNYDGNKSTFGDTSVAASVPNPDHVACFAARRTLDGALTVMVINKQLTAAAPVNVSLANYFPAGNAQVWQLTAANVLTQLPGLTFTGGTFSQTVPAQSITLFVLPTGTPPNLQAVGLTVTNTFALRLHGRDGQRYTIWSSSNLVNWLPEQTNLLAGNSLVCVLPAPTATRYFRARWLP